VVRCGHLWSGAVSLKHDGPTGRRAGRRVRRNGERRATRPRTRVACVWPVGHDDGPPDFILHLLSHGVNNVNYCTYCTSEQTPGQPMDTTTLFSYYCICLELCVCAYKTSGDDGRYEQRPSYSSSSIDVAVSSLVDVVFVLLQLRNDDDVHQNVIVISRRRRYQDELDVVTTTRQRRQRRCLDVDVVVVTYELSTSSLCRDDDDVNVITMTQRSRVIVDLVVTTSTSSGR